jgi:hypothetical protein
MHPPPGRPGVHPSELAMVEDLYDDHEVLLRSLQGSLAGNASLHCDFATTDVLTPGPCRSTQRWPGCCVQFSGIKPI